MSSATPYTLKNPSFDVVYLDPDTMRPVDYEIYYLDLDKTNKENKAEWELYFDYRKGYGMKNLSPTSYFNLAVETQFNET